MRLALISDIHGNLAALEAVLADVRRRGADRVINLGDHLSGPLLPKETAHCLQALDAIHLAGNHDREVLDLVPGRGGKSDAYARSMLGEPELAWLRGLRPAQRLGDDVLLCHGTPTSDCTTLLERVHQGELVLAERATILQRLGGETAALLACGHTHVPRAVRLPGGMLVVNPGSVGLQAYVDDDEPRHVMQLGSTDARYAIVERGPAGWTAELHAVPYDFAAMAQLARLRGRPEWDAALSTGYVR